MRISPLLLNPEHRAIIRMAEDDARQRIAQLTPAELLVVQAVIDGHQSKTIAYDLGRSSRTIENHRQRIMDKTGVTATVDLLRLMLLAE